MLYCFFIFSFWGRLILPETFTIFDVRKLLRKMKQEDETYCSNCGKPMQFKRLWNGSKFNSTVDYSILCGCGMEINRWHPQDEFHFGDFWHRSFIPNKIYIKNYKKLNPMERAGMKKQIIGKREVFRK